MEKRGTLELITGPMFSGKTEELIRRVKRIIIAKQKVIVFKPSIDTRYSEKYTVSHNGQRIEAINCKDSIDILSYLRDFEYAHAVAIDEVQFF